MEYGLQLYSIRDITENHLEEALQKTAALGYRFVEFAGFFGTPAAEVKAMLEKYGLEVSGTHTGYGELADHFEETLQYMQEIGNKNIIIPGADLSSQAKLDAFIAKVNELQPILAEKGIRLGYHNHDHEFRPNADGSVIYEQLIYRTDLELEIDTYWAYVGMGDPIALWDRIADRVHVIHIKDGDDKRNGQPLGLGTAPVKAVYEKARSLNIPMVVESETLNPDGLTEAKICIDYLRSLE